MVFSNLIFLYIFLPVCLTAYFLCRDIRAKNVVLIIFSLIFYAWGEPVYLFLMLAMAAANWGFGLLLQRQHRRAMLVLALVADLGCLAVFKYTGFFVENLNALLGTALAVPEISLPIGISFYTFQALSYTVDVWRGDVEAQPSFAKFLLYISLFPQLIAGPIVRYADVAAQIDERSFDATQAFYGATRFCMGLAKKVLLADAAGKVASQILGGSLATTTTVSAWLGMVLYTFEIYFDFSGYSDMAIGMGRIFGFKYMENFRLPYTSRSVTEFWRRWHISLSSFFRDYVYIPLGGKKKHRVFNMAAVWALTGLWHGASWNFVLWGVYFFVILVIEKQLNGTLRRIPGPVRHIVTMLLIIFGWNIFYFTDLTQLIHSFGVMFGLYGSGFSNMAAGISLINNLPLLLVCALGSTSIPQNIGNLFGGLCAQSQRTAGQVVYAVTVFLFDAALLALSTIALVGSTYNAFLYFRF